jgi:hypothetical protein
MSQTPTVTTTSTNYQSIFDNAVEAYKKKTKSDLRSHPLLDKLQNCDSPDAVLNILYQQIPGFDRSCGTDEELTKWLNPTINVLYTFSGVIGGGIGLVGPKEIRVEVVPDLNLIGIQVFRPAAVIFTGIGVLLSVNIFISFNLSWLIVTRILAGG